MSEQQNGKRARRKWSAMDTVILILIVAAVASVVGRVIYAYLQRGGEDEASIYTVDFDVADIREAVLQNVSGFDAVYLYESGARIGYIGVEESDGEQWVALYPKNTWTGQDLSEDESTTEEETLPVATGSTAAQGSMICTGGDLEDGCLYLDAAGLYIAPGSELKVCTDRVVFTLRVTRIALKES